LSSVSLLAPDLLCHGHISHGRFKASRIIRFHNSFPPHSSSVQELCSERASKEQFSCSSLSFSLTHITSFTMVSTSDVEINRNSDPLDHIPSLTLPNFPGSDQLPSAVLRRILNYTIHRIVNSGGNDVSYVVMRLTRIALVCRGWRKVAYLERKKGWMKADYEGNDRAFKELDCLYSVSQIGKSCTKGGVHFVIRDCEGRTENRRWDEDVGALVLACSNTKRATWDCYNSRRLNLSFMFRGSSFFASPYTDLTLYAHTRVSLTRSSRNTFHRDAHRH